MNAQAKARARTIAWKKRRRMNSGGMFAESRCGRYRLYESVLGGYSAGIRTGGIWQSLERRSDGRVLWHRKKRLAIAACETHKRQTIT